MNLKLLPLFCLLCIYGDTKGQNNKPKSTVKDGTAPQFSLNGQMGKKDGDRLGQAIVFYPYKTGNSVFALDVRGLMNFEKDAELNVGLTAGHLLANNLGFRGFAYFDLRKIADAVESTDNKKYLYGFTLGGELLYKNLIARKMFFIPGSDEKILIKSERGGFTSGRYKATDGAPALQAKFGAEGEIGLNYQFTKRLRGQCLAGGYLYGNLSDPDFMGVRLRTELAYNTGILEYKLGIKLEYDEPNGFRPMVMLGVSNSNKGCVDPKDYNTRILQEMQTAPYRDPDIRGVNRPLHFKYLRPGVKQQILASNTTTGYKLQKYSKNTSIPAKHSPSLEHMIHKLEQQNTQRQEQIKTKAFKAPKLKKYKPAYTYKQNRPQPTQTQQKTQATIKKPTTHKQPIAKKALEYNANANTTSKTHTAKPAVSITSNSAYTTPKTVQPAISTTQAAAKPNTQQSVGTKQQPAISTTQAAAKPNTQQSAERYTTSITPGFQAFTIVEEKEYTTSQAANPHSPSAFRSNGSTSSTGITPRLSITNSKKASRASLEHEVANLRTNSTGLNKGVTFKSQANSPNTGSPATPVSENQTSAPTSAQTLQSINSNERKLSRLQERRPSALEIVRRSTRTSTDLSANIQQQHKDHSASPKPVFGKRYSSPIKKDFQAFSEEATSSPRPAPVDTIAAPNTPTQTQKATHTTSPAKGNEASPYIMEGIRYEQSVPPTPSPTPGLERHTLSNSTNNDNSFSSATPASKKTSQPGSPTPQTGKACRVQRQHNLGTYSPASTPHYARPTQSIDSKYSFKADSLASTPARGPSLTNLPQRATSDRRSASDQPSSATYNPYGTPSPTKGGSFGEITAGGAYGPSPARLHSGSLRRGASFAEQSTRSASNSLRRAESNAQLLHGAHLDNAQPFTHHPENARGRALSASPRSSMRKKSSFATQGLSRGASFIGRAASASPNPFEKKN